MNKKITLTEEQLTKLTILVTEIDREESKEERDEDLVVENLYQICDIVRNIVI
jgi:hypothetical protein